MFLIHEGNKSFKCGICDYRCSQTIDFKKHVKSLHEGKRQINVNYVTIDL